ncbi:MAG: ABC transporter permease [Actinobacteria bacterium]|nr:ABC transporter permease [Actinomycetota bacterium]
MSLSLEYVAKETASNLWRNRVMTVAAVLTVGVSLSLVGASFLLKQGVSNANIQWSHGVNLNVFMNPNVTSGQKKAIYNQLKTLPQVSRISYFNHKASYDVMKKMFANQPYYWQNVTPQQMPPYYSVVLKNASYAPKVATIIGNDPGVKNARYPGQEVKIIEQQTRTDQVVFLVIAGVLLLSAILLILNAIRMAIFARRREMSVMKLVGATNWFVRLPFMLEGMVQGLIGALLAVVLLIWFGSSMSNLHLLNLPSAVGVTGGEIFMTQLFIVILGALVGSLGSAVAVRKFIEV